MPDASRPIEDLTDDQTRKHLRVSVQEAARLLGISPEAVRSRLYRGTLDKETGTDGTVYVRLRNDQVRQDYDQTKDASQLSAELVDELRAHVEDMREQLAEEHEARRRADAIIKQLSRINAERSHTIRQLEAIIEDHKGSNSPRSLIDSEAVKGRSTATRQQATDSDNSPGSTLTRGDIFAALLPRQSDTLSRRVRIIATISVILLGLSGLIFRFAEISLPGVLNTAITNGPLIIGLWMSIRWRGIHTLAYVYIASVIWLSLFGIMVTLEIIDVIQTWRSGDWDTFSQFNGTVWKAILYELPYTPAFLGLAGGPVLLFFAGGLLGDLVKRWAQRHKVVSEETPEISEAPSLSKGQAASSALVVALIALMGNAITAGATVIASLLGK